MWDFLYKKTLPPFRNVELLSVHLPKTGGQSFSKTLENIYGNKLLKAYSPTLIKAINENSIPKIPAKTKALHGHFEMNKNTRNIFPQAKIICWLRNPVERVISHYNYWQSFPEHGNPVHADFLKEKPSIEEFVTQEKYHRTAFAIHSFLNDFPLDEIFFAGRLAHYKDDLHHLAKLMNWPADKLHYQVENKNTSKDSFSSGTLSKLEALLEKEIKLYQKLIFRK